jgi:excisionase family DNA binding protein
MPVDTMLTPRGYTPTELAKLLRISPDKVRQWIKCGQLRAVNVASTLCGRPRFVILPDHIREWEQRRSPPPPPKLPRRRRLPATTDFYPDG